MVLHRHSYVLHRTVLAGDPDIWMHAESGILAAALAGYRQVVWTGRAEDAPRSITTIQGVKVLSIDVFGADAAKFRYLLTQGLPPQLVTYLHLYRFLPCASLDRSVSLFPS